MIVSFNFYGISITVSSRDDFDNNAIHLLSQHYWLFQSKDVNRDSDINIVCERISTTPLNLGENLGEIGTLGWRAYSRQSPFWYSSINARTWIRDERSDKNKIHIKIFSNEESEIIWGLKRLVLSSSLDLLIADGFSIWNLNGVNYLVKDDSCYLIEPHNTLEKEPIPLSAILKNKDLKQIYSSNYRHHFLPYAPFLKSTLWQKHPPLQAVTFLYS